MGRANARSLSCAGTWISAGKRRDTPTMNRTTDILFSREAWDQNAHAYEIIRPYAARRHFMLRWWRCDCVH
jgi:hypothetical protein